MEYLDQSEGLYEECTGQMLLRFEARGTRYEGRTEQIEKVTAGDAIQVIRDRENPFNPNNFTMLTAKGKNVGNMPVAIQVQHSRWKNIKQCEQPQHICSIAIGAHMSMTARSLFEELLIQKKPWKTH